MGRLPLRREQFLGCLLGQAVADAVGAPYEGLPSDLICQMCPGESLLQKAVEDELCYTDDTQMAIGVAETLIAAGEIQEIPLGEAFARNYQSHRGYGTGARLVLEAIQAGDDPKAIAENTFPGGSWGNGAAMRAAPIGLMFADDLDQAAEQARISSLPTHVHPIGIDGARVVALATALASRSQEFDRAVFFGELAERAETQDFREQLLIASKLNPGDSITYFGSGIEAHRSVVTALCCFAGAPQSYPDVISRAIFQGGDTDTIAAMAGAISGAHLGVDAIPGELLEVLEQGDRGGEFLRELGGRLYEGYLSRA